MSDEWVNNELPRWHYQCRWYNQLSNHQSPVVAWYQWQVPIPIAVLRTKRFLKNWFGSFRHRPSICVAMITLIQWSVRSGILLLLFLLVRGWVCRWFFFSTHCTEGQNFLFDQRSWSPFWLCIWEWRNALCIIVNQTSSEQFIYVFRQSYSFSVRARVYAYRICIYQQWHRCGMLSSSTLWCGPS